jgi:hypothetical protein
MAPKPKDNWYDETLTEAEKEAPIKNLKLFYKRVKAFMETNNLRGSAWPTISFDWGTPPSEQWLEWLEYFERHVEQVPVTMREMLDGQRPKNYEFTVPTEFPVLFDSTFRPNPDWKAPKPPTMTSREMHEKLAQLKARYGPNWGIKDMNKLGPRSKPFKAPTDDELRAIYGKRHDEPEVEF